MEKLTAENINLIEHDTVLVKFGAVWCGPCRMMDRILDNVSKKYESDSAVKILSVDIDEHADLAKEYNVTSVPTMVFLKNSLVCERFEGIKSEASVVDTIESVKLK